MNDLSSYSDLLLPAPQEARPVSGRAFVAGRPTGRSTKTSEAALWGTLARRTVQGKDAASALALIRDYNADASQAIWQFIRMVDQDPMLVVVDETGEALEDEAPQAFIDELAKTVMVEYGGGFEVLLNMLTLSLVTLGAAAAEVELDDDANEVIDLLPVDPTKIRFIEEDGRRAPAVVTATGNAVLLPPEQFIYVPMDPDIGDPHGRSPIMPTLETAFFQAQVLRDLKAVVHNQGWPRISVKVLRDIVYENAPAHLKAPNREDALRLWMNNVLGEIQDQYQALEPDDSFIHWDIAEVGYVGPGQVGSFDMKTVIQVIDNQVASSLKTLPVLLGRLHGAVQTHSNVQWDIYVKTINALRHKIGRIVTWLFGQALRVHGFPGIVQMRFSELRTTDRLAEAKADALRTEAAIRQVMAGFRSQDEAARELTGHDAVGGFNVPEMLVGLEAGSEDEQRAPSRIDTLLRQRGEVDEVGITPQWMQVGYRRDRREYRVFLERLIGRGAMAVERISDSEWEEAGGNNGRHG